METAEEQIASVRKEVSEGRMVMGGTKTSSSVVEKKEHYEDRLRLKAENES